MKQDLMVDCSVVLVDLDGKDILEVGGMATVREAMLMAGISPMVLDGAMNALRPFWGSADPEKKPLKLARAVANALQSDNSGSGADKIDRIRLAIKVMDPKQPVELSEKERQAILTCVEKQYGPVVYYRVHEHLNKTG